MTIKFEASAKDLDLIARIVDRAQKEVFRPNGIRVNRQDLLMDLTACHSNGCKLDFERLLEFPSFDFAHDIAGIRRHMDRNTGQLLDCFVPRSSTWA